MTTPELDPGALHRALFKASPDAILVVDGEGRVVLANPACEALLGYPIATLVGMSVDALIPRRFPAHARHRADFAANPKSRPMGRGLGLLALRADGVEFPVDISLAPVTLGEGKWTVCSLRDLRGRSTETLRIQSTALRSAANGIVITDRAGVIVWVNRAACQITGLRRSRAGRPAHPGAQVGHARPALLSSALGDRVARGHLVRDHREPAQGRHALP